MLYKNLRSVYVILLFSLLLSSCSSKREIPYKENITYHFLVKVKEKEKIVTTDTLSFIVNDFHWTELIFSGKTFSWSSKLYPSFSEGSGINISKNTFTIQMPIHYPLFEKQNIAIAPYPSNSKNDKEGYSSISEHQFKKGYGNLTGKTINQEEKVIKSEKIMVNNKEYNCQVVVGENTSLIDELGVYRIKTFYNNKYGFIKIIYQYPNDKIITLESILNS